MRDGKVEKSIVSIFSCVFSFFNMSNAGIYKSWLKGAAFLPWGVSSTYNSSRAATKQLASYGRGSIVHKNMSKRSYSRGPALRYASRPAKRMRTRGRSRYTRYPRRRYRRRTTWKQRARWDIGEKLGSNNCKVHEVYQTTGTNETIDTKTLFQREVSVIPHGGNRNQRQSNIVNVRGFRTELVLKNDLTEPLHVNMAWVHPKTDGALSSGSIDTTDFFRSYDGNRGEAFDATKTGLDFTTLKINTDLFTVLKHKRFCFAGSAENSTAWESGVLNSFRRYKFYVPLKRQLRFENTSATMPVEGNVFFVMWCSKMFDTSAQGATTDAITYQERQLCWFKEPKNH